MIPDVTTIDFESEAIERRPHYPPKPVGFSIKRPGERRSTYHAWGHPTENNCTKEQAARILRAAWSSRVPVLAQNGKFDYDIAETYFQLPRLNSLAMHDTLYLLFLHNPHARSMSLKPAAAEILGMPAEERDALKEWIIQNIPAAKKKKSEWGRYICQAPGKLVGKYADGDVIRTERLFKKLYPEIVNRGMLEAYQREQRLMPVLLRNEREGIRCDLPALERDYRMYLKAMDAADAWLRKTLHAPDLNLDADKDVGDVLDREGIVTEWTYTAPTKRHPGGQRSIAKKNMTIDIFHNKRVALVYAYRTRLATCLGTFFEPWLAMARESGGIIYTNWNQVRQSHGNDKFKGARTGRLSSNPNFQNIPKDFEDKDDGYVHPHFLKSLPPLPLMRRYLLPDVGGVWIHRDYAQQELRIMAHFEDGALLAKYNSDPKYDMHTDVQNLLRDAGIELTRSGAKIMNFGDLYGMGKGEFASRAHVTVAMADRIKKIKRAMMPDFAKLDDGIKQRARAGLPIRTWGGREYYCEEASYSKKYKRVMSWEHKLFNYLIQGSAGDCAKEAIIRYDEHPRREARFLVSVHDEANSSSPKNRVDEEMEILQEVMESVEFDTLMRSDGKTGKNWGSLKAYVD